MKKTYLMILAILVFNSLLIYATPNISQVPLTYKLSTSFNKNGNSTKVQLSYLYNDNLSADLMLKKSVNSNLDFTTNPVAVLNYSKEDIYEIYLTPYNYHKNLNDNSFFAGIGIYYDNDVLNEEGFIYLPNLYAENKAFNEFSNNLVVQSIGPIINLGYDLNKSNIQFESSLGIVPFYYLNFYQELKIDPLMSPTSKDFKTSNFGSPFIFVESNIDIWNLIKIQASYQFSILSLNLVDFVKDSISNDYIWTSKNETQLSNQLSMAISFKIPKLAVIGGGLIYSNSFVDSQIAYENTSYYFVFNIGG
ncbi:MAG: hypothetical protein EOL97_12080 [Spirochaetia bacterium]|nr:hypothetical protein [Spirochaetia bacterium]